MRSLLLGLLQLVGLAAALAGLYFLAGLAWVLVVGGLAVVATATLAEVSARTGRPIVTRREGES